MKKALVYAIAVAFAMSVGGVTAAPPAYAKSDKDKAALAECKKAADPKARDECVKQASDKAKSEKADKGKADTADKIQKVKDTTAKVKPEKPAKK